MENPGSLGNEFINPLLYETVLSNLFKHKISVKDLLNCRLVCKKWNAFAISSLQKNELCIITLETKEQLDSINSVLSSNIKQFPCTKFNCTICSNIGNNFVKASCLSFKNLLDIYGTCITKMELCFHNNNPRHHGSTAAADDGGGLYYIDIQCFINLLNKIPNVESLTLVGLGEDVTNLDQDSPFTFKLQDLHLPKLNYLNLPYGPYNYTDDWLQPWNSNIFIKLLISSPAINSIALSSTNQATALINCLIEIPAEHVSRINSLQFTYFDIENMELFISLCQKRKQFKLKQLHIDWCWMNYSLFEPFFNTETGKSLESLYYPIDLAENNETNVANEFLLYNLIKSRRNDLALNDVRTWSGNLYMKKSGEPNLPFANFLKETGLNLN